MPTIDQAIAVYIKLRDSKQKLAKEQAEAMRPFNQKLEQVENWLLAVLNKQDAESIRTDHGTCYKSTRTQAKVADWDAALEYIVENEMYQMLERRVSKAAVEEFVEAQGAPPPGVEITQEVRVNVRR